jgi:diacylglycerol kinase (ATP)
MKNRKLLDSFNCAIKGIIEAIKCERNMRIHMIAALLVLTACFFYDLSKVELLIVTITITLVIITEMINTAIEFTLDAVIDYYHPLVKKAKNISAGAVLITSVNSVLVGYIIFWDRLRPFTFSVMKKVRDCNPYLIFFILVVVCIITILLKILYGEGTPLKGGMPSGHSAVAFSIATTIAYLIKEPLAIVLGYILAAIVAQSRVDSEVHSVIEVILGSVIGILLTILILKIFLFRY